MQCILSVRTTNKCPINHFAIRRMLVISRELFHASSKLVDAAVVKALQRSEPSVRTFSPRHLLAHASERQDTVEFMFDMLESVELSTMELLPMAKRAPLLGWCRIETCQSCRSANKRLRLLMVSRRHTRNFLPLSQESGQKACQAAA